MARFPDYRPAVVPASQVGKVLKYLADKTKVAKVSRPITYNPKTK